MAIITPKSLHKMAVSAAKRASESKNSSSSSSSSSSRSSSSRSSTSRSSSSSNKKVTFTDIAGKEHTTDKTTFDKWKKAGNVAYVDESSFGPETVEKLIKEQEKTGSISSDEASKRISESYASEGALLYSQGVATDDKNLQRTSEKRIVDYIKMGKTTPEEVEKQLGQPYIQENYDYFKSGIINVNLPMQKQTITRTYAPLANLYGQNQQSIDQLGLMASVNADMGMIIFTLSSDNRIVVKDGVSPDLYNLAITKAEQRGLNVGGQVQVDTKPKQSLYSDNGEYNPSDIFFTETKTTPTDYNVDTSNLHGRDGTTDVLYETVGDKDIPRYKKVDGEFVPLTEINGQYIYIPEGYKYSSEGFLIPKDVQISKEGVYYQDDVYFKQKDGVLLPDYRLDVQTDDTTKTSKIDKQPFLFNEKTGEYYTQTTTTTEQVVLPDGFKKINIPLLKKDSVIGKAYDNLYKDTNTNIFYKGGKDNTLTPAFKIEDGKFIKATKVKTNINDLLPDNYKSDFSKNIENLNLTSQDDRYMFMPEIPVEEKIDPMLKYRENISMQKQIDEMKMTGWLSEFKDIGRDIGYVRDSLYFAFALGTKQYEGFYDTTLTPSVEQFLDSTFLLPSKLISEGLEQSFGPNPISRTMNISRQFAKDISVEVTGVFFKTPSKTLGNFALGSYEYSIFDAQQKGGFKFEKDVQTLDLKFNVPFTNINLIDSKMDVPRSALDSSVRFAEASLYSISILSGVAGGITSFTAPTAATTTTKAGIPLIFKSAGIGAGFGIGKVGFDMSQGQSYTLEEAFRVIGKSTGTAMGFAGLSEVSKAGTIYAIENSGKLATASKNIVFEDVTISPRDKGLLRLQESYKTSDGSYEWTAQFQRTQYKPFIRDLFVSEKDVFINLPFEKIKYTGTTMTYTPIGQTPTSIFTDGYGQTSIMKSFLYQPNKVVTVSKHFYFGEEVSRSLSFSKIQNIGETNLISTGKDFNLGSKNILDISHKATFDVDKIISKNYHAPKVKGDITLIIDGKPTPSTYEYFDWRNIKPTLTKGYSASLTKLEALKIETPLTQTSAQTGSYSPVYITFDDSISFYNPDAFVKEIKLEKPLTKDTSIQRIKIDKGITKSVDVGLDKGSIQLQKTKTETVLNQKPIASVSLQDTQYLYSFEQNIAKVNEAIINLGALSKGLEKTKMKDISLTNQKEISIVQTGLVPKNLELQRTITRDLTKRETGLITIERTNIIPIEKTDIIPFETEKVDIITITDTEKIFEKPFDVKPVDPIPPIYSFPTPPVLLGGGWDNRGYPFSWKKERGGLQERRVSVASITAGVFGVKTKGLRGTSFDTRFEAVKNKVEQPKFISRQPKIKLKPFNKVVSKKKVKTPTIKTPTMKIKQPKMKTIKIPKF